MVGNLSQLIFNVKHGRKVVIIDEVQFFNVMIRRQYVGQCHIPVVLDIEQEADIVFHLIDLNHLVDQHVGPFVSIFLKLFKFNHFRLEIAVEDCDKVLSFDLFIFWSLTFFIVVEVIADGELRIIRVLLHSCECL